MRSLLSVLLFAVAALAGSKLKPLPEYFDVCHRNDQQIGACLKRAIENSRPKLIKGIPEMGLPAIEPLRIQKIEMKQGSGNFRVELLLTDLIITGSSQYVIQNASLSLETQTLNLTAFVKTMDFYGDYNADMKILIVPVKGKGKATFNFTDVTLKGNMHWELIKKDGKDYFHVKDVHLLISPKGVRSYFTNLFNGDKKLGETTNTFLNNNGIEAYEAYRALPEDAFGSWMKATCNQVFSKYPYDVILPP